MSRVGHITCYSAKGMPGQSMDRVTLVKDLGIEGDYHATGGDRQVTLISQKAKAWMQAQEVSGFCFAKFKENIVVEDLLLEGLPEEGELAVGEALLQLAPTRKTCHGKHCILKQEKEACMLIQEVRFARVTAGGIIVVGMEIMLKGDHPYSSIQRLRG